MEKFYVSYISTVSVSDKIFGKKYENQAKLKKTRKLWYLLSPKFRPLFLNINFWRGGRALDRIPIQLWDFLSIYFPNFLWSYVLKFGTFRTRRNYSALLLLYDIKCQVVLWQSGNFWGKSHTTFIILNIELPFACDESKLHRNTVNFQNILPPIVTFPKFWFGSL